MPKEYIVTYATYVTAVGDHQIIAELVGDRGLSLLLRTLDNLATKYTVVEKQQGKNLRIFYETNHPDYQ